MKLENVQSALFAAYDLQNAMTTSDKRRPTANEDFGNSLTEVIEFLAGLEAELEAETAKAEAV